MKLLAALLPLFFCVPARAEPAKKTKPPPEFEAAIQKGVAWLQKDLEADLKGNNPNKPGFLVTSQQLETAELSFKALALVHAGVPTNDPVIVEAWKRCGDCTFARTYDMALRLLLCEALLNKPAKTKKGGLPAGAVKTCMAQIADQLVSRRMGGAWSYGSPPRDAIQRKAGVDYAIGGEELRKLASSGDGDFSNTQFAVLGLKAAALHKIRPKDADLVWRVVVQRFLDGQQADGPETKVKIEPEDPKSEIPWIQAYDGGFSAKARGWGYSPNTDGGKPYASMTSCGLGALLVARSEIPDLSPDDKKQIDEAIRSGVAWLSANFAVDKNALADKIDWWLPKEAVYYNLYGLERTGVLAGLKKIDSHDWYREGGDFLVKAQAPDGSWKGLGHETTSVRTGFALLFLARATSPRYALPYTVGQEAGPETPKQ